MRPLWLDPGEIYNADLADPAAPPKIENFFFVALRSRTFMGAVSADASRAAEIDPDHPRTDVSRAWNFRIRKPAINFRALDRWWSAYRCWMFPEMTWKQFSGVAGRVMGMVAKEMPRDQGNQLRPNPGLELGAPEVRVLPDRTRLADAGVTVRELGDTVDTFNDGLRVAEVTIGGERLDLMLAGPRSAEEQTQTIAALPVVTRSGSILPTGSLAEVVLTSGPDRDSPPGSAAAQSP